MHKVGKEAVTLAKGGRREPLLPPRPTVANLLRLIWTERRISRAELARRTELSRSTVSLIVSELLTTGLVAEVGAGPSRGGRRPIVLEFQDNAFGIIGIDMGASHLAVALTNLRGEVQAWAERRFPVRTDPPGTCALLVELTAACLAKLPGGTKHLVGIGIGVPCPVDPRHPEALEERVMPQWKGTSVVDELRAHFGVPVLLDNDANLGALAECWWGVSRGVANSAFLKVATGVGSGHIIEGQIYRGAHGAAGEIGHLAIDPQGPPCICGLRGCLVTLVGSQALLARAEELLPRFPQSRFARSERTITTLEDSALAGDPLALEVIREAAQRLGIAIAGLANVMNPEVVSVGGSLARLGDLLLEPLRETVRTRSFVAAAAGTRIVASELGSRDVAVGAATLVLQAALENVSFPGREPELKGAP